MKAPVFVHSISCVLCGERVNGPARTARLNHRKAMSVSGARKVILRELARAGMVAKVSRVSVSTSTL